MAERYGLTMLLMFTARNYKVNGTKNAACRNSMFGVERFKRYGPGMFSDLVCHEACQCDSKQDIL